MSLVEELHNARKARLERMGALPRYQAPVISVEKAPVEPQKFNAGWQSMWFSDLINVPSVERRMAMVRDIQEAVCKYFGISLLDLLSDRRSYDIVFPRQIAFYLCRAMTVHGFAEIGRRFGGKDHSTVMHGIQKTKDRCRKDWLVAYDVAHIEARL